jgi:hypothetical protein
MIFGKLVKSPVQKPFMANDHETSSNSLMAKYFQPRWCPPGLTSTQKRKLQCLRFQDKKEQEAEKLRDEQFNQYRPMVPQSKVWRVKAADQQAGPVEPPQPTGLTGTEDRSDRPAEPVRPVAPGAEQKAESVAPASALPNENYQRLLRHRMMRSWWIMGHHQNIVTWRSTLCACLRITL